MRATSLRSAKRLPNARSFSSLGGGRIAALSAVWALIVTASVYVHLLSSGWTNGEHLTGILLPFALGSFAGSAWGIWAADAWGIRRPPAARFALFFVLVTIATVTMTALLFYLPYRAYFAQWHADFLSVPWAFQVVFTGLSTLYLFLTTGLKPLIPVPILVLFVLSLLFSRGSISSRR